MYVYISRALRAPCNLRSDPGRCLAASTFASLPACPLSLSEWSCITLVELLGMMSPLGGLGCRL